MEVTREPDLDAKVSHCCILKTAILILQMPDCALFTDSLAVLFGVFVATENSFQFRKRWSGLCFSVIY